MQRSFKIARNFRLKRNVTQTKAFSERLQAAIARYHTKAFTTMEVLGELAAFAKDIRSAQKRGEKLAADSTY